jgi:hypothetical protein
MTFDMGILSGDPIPKLSFKRLFALGSAGLALLSLRDPISFLSWL